MVSNRQNFSDRDPEITRIDYRGWRDSYLVTNGIVEALIVSSISRIMQFRFAGCERGVFWENRALDGMPVDSGTEWRNFGGDKPWPAPQEDWEKVSGRAWPPPLAFDSACATARREGNTLTLVSPIDENYGVQVVRRITLRPGLPVMDISTQYNKVSGAPINIAVWVVTQLCDPHSVYALLPDYHDAGQGYTQLMGPPPTAIERNGRLLSFRRDPTHNLKIATSASSLVWINEEHVLRIDAVAGEGECNTAVYTNKDPLQYVELETEGPTAELKIGETVELTNTYTLVLRSMDDETAEVCNILGEEI